MTYKRQHRGTLGLWNGALVYVLAFVAFVVDFVSRHEARDCVSKFLVHRPNTFPYAIGYCHVGSPSESCSIKPLSWEAALSVTYSLRTRKLIFACFERYLCVQLGGGKIAHESPLGGILALMPPRWIEIYLKIVALSRAVDHQVSWRQRFDLRSPLKVHDVHFQGIYQGL